MGNKCDLAESRQVRVGAVHVVMCVIERQGRHDPGSRVADPGSATLSITSIPLNYIPLIAQLHPLNYTPLTSMPLNYIDQSSCEQVPEADARGYAAESGLLYFETSAKDNVNVAAVFEEVADK